MRATSFISSVSTPSWPRAMMAGSLAAMLAASVSGYLVAVGRSTYLVAALGVVLVLAIGLRDWRWSIWGLLLYIPFLGIPTFILYPNTGVPALAKDLLFVLPSYVGFAAWVAVRRQPVRVPGAPIFWMLALAVLVVVNAFNPSIPNFLIGLIGLKVWLLYIPMYFLGYHLVSTKRELFAVLALLSLPAAIPTVIGIGEAALYLAGQAAVVYSIYGPGASAATQRFFGTSYPGGGVLKRVPSTFPSMTQYYQYSTSMIAVTFAWWRGHHSATKRGAIGAILCLLAVVATLLSGSRGAFVMVPPLAVGLLLLTGGPLRHALWLLLVVVVGYAVVVTRLGLGLDTLLGTSTQIGALHLASGPLDAIPTVIRTTMLGFGTGVDSQGARYVPSWNGATVAGVGWQESWITKILIEIGVPGLLVCFGLLLSLIVRAVRDHLRLRDPELRPVSAAIIVLSCWCLINSVTSPVLDLDPTNVYFWLFLGIAARLPNLASDKEVSTARLPLVGPR